MHDAIAPLAHALWIVFAVLACWHVGMAFMPSSGRGGAVPTVNGKPLFTPTRAMTLAVAAALLLMAALIAATAGIVQTGFNPLLLSGLCYALAAGLLARAVGDFKYLGFFKRVRGSRFATLDTFVFAPLCLALAAGVALLARYA